MKSLRQLLHKNWLLLFSSHKHIAIHSDSSELGLCFWKAGKEFWVKAVKKPLARKWVFGGLSTKPSPAAMFQCCTASRDPLLAPGPCHSSLSWQHLGDKRGWWRRLQLDPNQHHSACRQPWFLPHSGCPGGHEPPWGCIPSKSCSEIRLPWRTLRDWAVVCSMLNSLCTLQTFSTCYTPRTDQSHPWSCSVQPRHMFSCVLEFPELWFRNEICWGEKPAAA